jgi:four helix bundle protein
MTADLVHAYPHRRLLAYQRALSFYHHVVRIRAKLPRGSGELSDQLHRAASSIVLNLAEGSSAWATGDKRRYFQIALASTGECSAVLDLLEAEVILAHDDAKSARGPLDEAAALTVGLIRRLR